MRIALAVLALAVLSPAFPAGAQTCRQQAKIDYKACTTSCRSDFTDAKAGCLNITPGCFSACQDGRQECVDTATQPLTDCLATCQPPLDQAKAGCRTFCMCGGQGQPACGFDACFIGCVSDPESTAFDCRNTCRGAFKLNSAAQAALAMCKPDFKSCLASCPPATPTTTTTTAAP
jgi:hypothetical protein